MKTMQPLLKKRASPVSTSELMERLEKADAVTMQPLQRAMDEASPPTAPVVAPKPRKPAKAAMPWDDVDEKAVQPFSARINSRLYLKLKYFGESTPGKNMTQILHDALEKELDQMQRKRDKEMQDMLAQMLQESGST